jgi:hypothetical protein
MTFDERPAIQFFPRKGDGLASCLVKKGPGGGTPLRSRRNKIQTGGADCGASIGDPDEDDFVSSGLQFAGQRGRRIEVTG